MSMDIGEPKPGDLLLRIISIIEQARSSVVRTVNTEMVKAYWFIGREIVEEEQSGASRAEYGEELIAELSKRLTDRYGRGFSATNLKYCRQFYLIYRSRTPEVDQSSTAASIEAEKRHALRDQFNPNLSWTHYRHFDLHEILSRREPSTLKALAALLHRESICPGAGIPLLDTLGENSHKHAYSVSEDLKYAVREAVEWLGNEAVWYLRERRRRGVFGSTDSAEAIDPAVLRELEMVPLTTQEAQAGFYIHDSLQLLFNLVFNGFEPSKQQQALGIGGTAHHTFDIAPLKSHLFDPDRTPILNRCRFRNRVLQQVIHLLSLSSGKGQRGGHGRTPRRGRISYAQLGINQLGAVYEGLLSYSGFFVTDEGGLYEVKKAGEEYDELQNAYFVPASELEHYSDDEKFIPQPDPDHPGRAVRRLKHYSRGTFIYRLAGRNRQKSASYYTPAVLTQCVVKYALQELLKDKTADDILRLTVCEPAMGSGAFLNEAITQLAEAYLKARMKAEGGRMNLGHDAYAQELQKVKAYIAANNVYGVDLNPVAVELAEVSLWLNTMHPGCPVPWLSMQLVAGSSLVGARRQAFSSHLLCPRRGNPSWLDEVPKRYALHKDKGERIKDERPRQSVYHFLLPDTGMANYNDRVVKQMAAAQLDAMKTWRAAFCRPFESHHIAILERLSTAIDRLWQEHIRDRQKPRAETRDPWPSFPSISPSSPSSFIPPPSSLLPPPSSLPLTTQEKDRLFNERILSRIDANSSAYRRLKLVMDYWCALWYWPIEKADMLPTREAFLLEIQSIIEGGVIETTLIEKDQYLLNLGHTPVQQELDIYQERGYVNLEKLCRDYPRLALVQELAERYRFHHWALEFADLFAERGGFDLVVGNPPWIKVEWSEGGVLGDANPRFVFDKLSASSLNQMRDATLAQYPGLRSEYLAEFEEAEATQNFLNGYQNYPMLRGVKANLYKCFLPQAWYIGRPSGASGFLHPEGVYDDPKGGRFREQIYPRLRYHFQFANELNLFADVDHHAKFSINAYCNPPATPRFDHIANLYAVQTIDTCYAHSGYGPVEGIKDDSNNWNINGHRQRIVQVESRALELFAQLYDEPGTPALQARLPAIHADEILSVLEKFANQPRCLGDLKGEYFSTQHWNETLAQDDGTIRRDTQFPQDTGQWILSGPHFYVSNPFNKTPRVICIKNSDYDPLDLELLPEAYLPRTNYVPACDPVTYRNRTPKVPWDGRSVTAFYRFVNREMIGPAAERTLIPSILPKSVGHVHTCISRVFTSQASLLDFFAMTLSVPVDFRVESTGSGPANVTLLNQLPMASNQSGFRSALHLRALRLTCLTNHYADLWTECWDPAFQDDKWAKADPRLSNDRFRKLTPQWTRCCVLRTDFERRQALVEIDVLAAMALGLTCDELCAIYRIQFPVLRQNENDTWYDQNGRIVFTCSKGLPGVGLDRTQWEKESNLTKLENADLRIEGIAASDFTTVKNMPHGTITRTVTDDTVADYRYAYGTFRKDGVTYQCPCPEHPEPIEGPVERDITYVAPFTRCNREEDYQNAWRHFEERMKAEG